MVFWFLEEVPSYREVFFSVTFTVIHAPAHDRNMPVNDNS